MAPISIIIPAYNEEGAIGPTIDRIRALSLEKEIIVVDDASSDRTAAIAEQHGARVVRRPVNIGYGRALKDGIHAASHDLIAITDADGSYPVEQIATLLVPLSRGADMVVGARQGAAYRGSFLKMLSRMALKIIVEFATGRTIPDINSGLRVFRKSDVVPYFPDICESFSFTTTITLVYLLTHRTVVYFPISYDKRVGRSKVRHVRDALRTLQYVTECLVHYNPLKLFLLLSLFTLLVGIVASLLFGIGALLQSMFFTMVIVALGLIAESLRRPRR